MKFSVRDLFWLILVAGIGCSWWLDRERLNQTAEQDRETIGRLRAFGIDVNALLRDLANPPPAQKFIRLKRQLSNTTGFDSKSDYQAPPQRPGMWIERIERQSSSDLPARP